jgi:hypothetical protein
MKSDENYDNTDLQLLEHNCLTDRQFKTLPTAYSTRLALGIERPKKETNEFLKYLSTEFKG